jgi:hypothetical protein
MAARPGVWPYVLGSAALELTYFVLLTVAYARAPAHAVYPVARGLGPALLLPVVAVAGGGIPALRGDRVLADQWGVLLTALGEADRKAVMAAVRSPWCIAAYTFLDGHGVRHADPATYLWLTMLPIVPVLLITRLIVSGPRALREATAPVDGRVRTGDLRRVRVDAARAEPGSGGADSGGGGAARDQHPVRAGVVVADRPARRPDSGAAAPGVATAAGAVLVFGGVAVLALS